MMAGALACHTSRGLRHRVEPGETLYRIGVAYGVSHQTLARANGYLDALQARGLPRDAGRVGVTRALHIVRNDAERRRAYERRRETITNIAELAHRSKAEMQALSDEQIRADDAPLIGTPDEIIERLQKLADGGVVFTGGKRGGTVLEPVAFGMSASTNCQCSAEHHGARKKAPPESKTARPERLPLIRHVLAQPVKSGKSEAYSIPRSPIWRGCAADRRRCP